MSLFKWWKELRAANTPVPQPTIYIYEAAISQTSTDVPTLVETQNNGLTLTPHRTSAGLYTLTGLPTGYTIAPYLNSNDPDKATAISVTSQTATLHSYNSSGVAADAILASNKIAFICRQT